jgi:hypothetical protein
MNTRILVHYFLVLIFGFSVISCDSTYNEVGSDIVGDTSFEFGTPKNDFGVIAYNQGLGPIDSKNLPVNALGIYESPVFGTTKANFATQVQLAVTNPTFDAALSPEIDSVYLTIPYFSTKTAVDQDGVGTYKLDSIYGSDDAFFDLKVYESGYYIRDTDPTSTTQSAQSYYTNQNADFDAVKVGELLNDSPADNQNTAFFFSNSEYNELTTSVDGVESLTRKAPAMRLKLNNDFFKRKIFDDVNGNLLNNNIFKNYFRGLYFKVDQVGTSTGNLALLNFKGGSITISYKQYASAPDDDPNTPLPEKVQKSIVLNMTGNSVSLLEQTNSPNYTAVLPGNSTTGDAKLYVKGGAEGTMAVVKLFTNGELADLRDKYQQNKLIVNDASLTFYIDNSTMSSAYEPNRIYLYDIKNKRPLIDYYTDQYSNSLKPKYSKNVHGGIISKQSDGRGTKYKIRITNHIRNLIKYADSTNVELGLVVTENIGVVSNKRLKNSFIIGTQTVSETPTMSAVNMLGTVLFGSTTPSSPNEDKKLKLTIYYTEPK